MSKGSPSNDAAIKLQKESLAQNALQNKQMLALLQSQVDTARQLKLPKIAPPMPLPDNGSADQTAQLQETRRNFMKRDGFSQTIVAPVASPLKTAMGVPMFQMAALWALFWIHGALIGLYIGCRLS